MKRNILLLLGLVGLVALEYGCTKEGPSCSGSSAWRVTGLESVSFYENTTGGPVFVPLSGSQPYDKLVISVNTQTEEIVSSYSGSKVYAVLPPSCTWQPDSLAVIRDGENITDRFTMRGQEISDVLKQESSDGWCGASFEPKESAANNLISKYTFQFFESGEKMEITSQRFKITK